jgi:hypothetical protein
MLLTLGNTVLIGVGMNVHKLTDLFAEKAGPWNKCLERGFDTKKARRLD